jgi:transcriptional regulator with XRE-family HTH domain
MGIKPNIFVFNKSNTKVLPFSGLLSGMDVENFGQRVRRLRLARNMTQAQLAERAGFKNQSSVGNIEAQERKGSANTVALARALGVTAEYLDTGVGPAVATLDEQLAQLLEQVEPERRERIKLLMLEVVRMAVPDEVVEQRMPVTKSLKQKEKT